MEHTRSSNDRSPLKSLTMRRMKNMNTLLKGAAVLAVLISPALAQSPSSQSNSTTSPQNQSPKVGETGSNAATIQKIRQDLQNAGFTDIKVVAESFVVQAKSKDGDAVLMTIGPHGMSVFEAMGTNSNSSSTTGSATSNPSNPAQ